jgi:serine/threonine protein kinase/Flp pilus assembly protein TadD
VAHGTMEHPQTGLNPERPDIALDPSSVGAGVEFHTSVAEVRLRTAAELERSSWERSVNGAMHGSPEQVQFFMDLHRSKPEVCHRMAEAAAAWPEVGTELMGFRLFARLGHGAFGRVYLAQQADLASRFVVLKVSPRIDDEARALAQLQHTNIVPIYSVHRAGPLQGVCMPYFGATTLGTVLKALDDRKTLPASGKELVGTIVACQTTVRESVDSRQLAASSISPSAFGSQQPEVSSQVGGPESSHPASSLQPVREAPNLDLLQGLSYVEAVLWIGSGLAGGLAHAHERGIVHRDLKPANVLLTDDGQPMLLDFNLAQDTKPGMPAATAQAGGTLPFMAPEQIEAFRDEVVLLDYRGDIYSLGVIMYQLLTSQRPFPTRLGTVKEVLESMVQDRLQAPPAVRCWNKAVTPAIESIIHKCLAPDPKQRYQNAAQLKEDLDRHLENLPLRHASEPSLAERARKWKRRHPRLASTTSVAILAALVIAVLLSVGLFRERRLADMDARASLGDFLDSKKNVQFLLTARTDDPAEIGQGIEQGRGLLATYGVLENPAWRDQASIRRLPAVEQDRLSKNTAELLLLLARGLSLQATNVSDSMARQQLVSEALRFNELAESCRNTEQPSRALWSQRADLMSLLGREEEANSLRAKCRETPLRDASDYYQVAAEHTAKGRYREALPLLAEATAKDPQDFWAWFLRGVCHDHLAQGIDALACYNTCIALAPDSPWAHMNRGLTHLRQQNHTQALADLDQVIAQRPKLIEAYKHRAIARQGLKQYAEAAEDLSRALELGAPPTHVYFLRAAVRERLGDREGAKQDRVEGLRLPPTDEMGWLTRGYSRMNAEPTAALEDFDQALKLNARSLAALQNKAHILGKLGRNEEAAKVLDMAVELYPDFIQARAGRGVLLARLGRREAAHKDAVDCLARDNKPMTIYQLAGIYALTSEKNPDDRQQAFRLLSVSLQKGIGFDLIETDKDLDPIRKSPEFQKLIDAARAIRVATAVQNRKS